MVPYDEAPLPPQVTWSIQSLAGGSVFGKYIWQISGRIYNIVMKRVQPPLQYHSIHHAHPHLLEKHLLERNTFTLLQRKKKSSIMVFTVVCNILNLTTFRETFLSYEGRTSAPNMTYCQQRRESLKARVHDLPFAQDLTPAQKALWTDDPVRYGTPPGHWDLSARMNGWVVGVVASTLPSTDPILNGENRSPHPGPPKPSAGGGSKGASADPQPPGDRVHWSGYNFDNPPRTP